MKFHISLLCIVVFLGLNVLHENQSFGQLRGSLPTPKAIEIPDDGVEVEMLRFNTLPMIEAKINGKGPFRFVVDTGAAGIVLKKSLAQELELPAPPGMPKGQQIRVRAPGSDGLSATIHYVDELQVGAVRISGVFTISMEMPFGEGIDGVIGMDVFNDCLLTYDYPHNRIALRRGELGEVDDAEIFSFTNPQMPNSHPQIEFKIGGQPYKFLIDTGLSGWFAVSRTVFEKAGFDMIEGPKVGKMGMSVAGPIPTSVARVNTTISLGEIKVENPVVRIIDGTLAKCVVGTHFLENFTVTFDAKNRRVKLRRSSTKDLLPPAVRNLGIGLRKTAGKMIVTSVHPESHAATVGIKVNDRIVAINGRPAEDVYYANDWRDVLGGNEQLTIEYQAEGVDQTKTVKLKVLEILSSARH